MRQILCIDVRSNDAAERKKVKNAIYMSEALSGLFARQAILYPCPLRIGVGFEYFAPLILSMSRMALRSYDPIIQFDAIDLIKFSLLSGSNPINQL